MKKGISILIIVLFVISVSAVLGVQKAQAEEYEELCFRLDSDGNWRITSETVTVNGNNVIVTEYEQLASSRDVFEGGTPDPYAAAWVIWARTVGHGGIPPQADFAVLDKWETVLYRTLSTCYYVGQRIVCK